MSHTYENPKNGQKLHLSWNFIRNSIYFTQQLLNCMFLSDIRSLYVPFMTIDKEKKDSFLIFINVLKRLCYLDLFKMFLFTNSKQHKLTCHFSPDDVMIPT